MSVQEKTCVFKHILISPKLILKKVSRNGLISFEKFQILRNLRKQILTSSPIYWASKMKFFWCEGIFLHKFCFQI